ncbi:MAG TPA: nucleotidyltransferase family protein [Polyangiales bacterium]|nr:nucleotidyltransferase family protein [Polyangiales bacterium]
MKPLLETLFSLLLTTRERGLAARQRAILAGASEEEWRRAVALLTPHKVFPLLSYQLRAFELFEQLPAAAREPLHAMHDDVRNRNALLMLTLARILRLLSSRGESVLLLKGILFADSFYPDFSTRPMGDIDLVAVRGRDEALFELLMEAGFRPSFHHPVQEHGITYMNREGVFVDAHRTLPLFVAEPWHRIRREVELTRVRGVPVFALEPNAMVAHLVTHMQSHAPGLGFVLLWIVDLALVLRKYAGELDLHRIRKLIGGEHGWALFLRLARLIQGAGEPIPKGLAKAARTVPALSLSTALRQRRIQPWGLPGALGWARLLAHQLGLHRAEDRPLPEPADLVLWPLDQLSERMAPPLARVANDLMRSAR